MKKGYALIMGVNQVDPEHYSRWDGSLSQPESDAQAIKNRADKYGFESKLLMTENVTRDNVIREIRHLALKAEAGDIVFIYYSGHGGQVPTLEYYDEDDELNETWCLYDGQLIDKELYNIWPQYKEGVRVFLVSDSCHSGTMTKVTPGASENKLIPKNMPDYLIKDVFSENIDFYTKIYKRLASLPKEEIKIPVMSYGACRDDQCSYAFRDSDYSLFTTYFIQMINTPTINSLKDISGEGFSYAEAIESIKEKVKEDVGRAQTPCIYEIGKKSSFRDQILLQI